MLLSIRAGQTSTDVTKLFLCVVMSMPNAGTLSALIAVPVKLVLLEIELHAQVNNPRDSIRIVDWI